MSAFNPPPDDDKSSGVSNDDIFSLGDAADAEASAGNSPRASTPGATPNQPALDDFLPLEVLAAMPPPPPSSGLELISLDADELKKPKPASPPPAKPASPKPTASPAGVRPSSRTARPDEPKTIVKPATRLRPAIKITIVRPGQKSPLSNQAP